MEKTTSPLPMHSIRGLTTKTKNFSQIKLSGRGRDERRKETRKNAHANCPLQQLSEWRNKKISHNLIPQQCKPKHFPATQNAILRIYFGSQRMICQFYTIFSHSASAEIKLRDFFQLKLHSQFHQFVKWHYQKPKRMRNKKMRPTSWGLTVQDNNFQSLSLGRWFGGFIKSGKRTRNDRDLLKKTL